MVHLRAPDLDVTGATLPGIPGVIVGHNRRIAWGVTNLGFDVQDLYREQIDLENGPLPLSRTVSSKPAWNATRSPSRARRRSSSHLWVTRHGPDLPERRRRALLDALGGGGGLRPVQFPVLDIDRARNWDEFNAALKSFPGPAQNFVYADVDGNIGYHAAGRFRCAARTAPAMCRSTAPRANANGRA